MAADELTSSMGVDASESPYQILLGQVLVRLGACEFMLNWYEATQRHLQQGLQYVVAEQDRAFGLLYLGANASNQGELSVGHAHLQESLALSRRVNDLGGMAQALYRSSLATLDADAVCLNAEALALWRRVGRPDCIAIVLNELAWYTCCLGDYAQATAYWQESIVICEQLEQRCAKAWALTCMGWAAWCQHDLATAERRLQNALNLYSAMGITSGVGMCQAQLALVMRSMRQIDQALQLARQAVAITRQAGNEIILVLSLNYLGAVLIEAGELIEARQVLSEAGRRAWEAQYLAHVMTTFYFVAELLTREAITSEPPSTQSSRCQTVALLTHVCNHPAARQIFKDKAAHLQTEIQATLPTELYVAAIQHGNHSSLHDLIGPLLCTPAGDPIVPTAI
jgi:tetratricopeptide (TPR) repeat protein